MQGTAPNVRKAPELDGPLDISYTPPVPESHEAFAALVAGRPPADVVLLVARIRAANAAVLNSENRRKMQARRAARPCQQHVTCHSVASDWCPKHPQC